MKTRFTIKLIGMEMEVLRIVTETELQRDTLYEMLRDRTDLIEYKPRHYLNPAAVAIFTMRELSE